jgi:4-amino-4-deoxy-L-arabinose transferase-like glycosyltransferase
MNEPGSRSLRLFWTGALVLCLVFSVLAALRGGYIGPDYYTHFGRLTDWKQVCDFSASNPPIYYFLGYGMFRLIGPRNAFPITLSVLQIVISLLALAAFFIYCERRFRSPLVYLGFACFFIFLPVRVIHATTVGTDWATIPLFILILFVVDRFLTDSTSTPANAALLGLALATAIFTKYSFMGLLPAVFLLFISIWKKRNWKLRRFVLICLLALAFPSAVAAYSFWASSRVHGYNTEKHWLPKGMPPDMDFKDLFTVKPADIQLFRAPEYFKRDILSPHKHSYLALSHMATFTDSMNLFQDLSVPQHFGAVLIPDQKIRRSWKTPVMQASLVMGTFWTLLALAGTAWTLALAIRNLFQNKLEREELTAILAIAFFLVIFLPIPFVHAGALFGYWTPRLILPALLYFFWAAFLLIDRKIVRQRTGLAAAVFLLVFIQCALEIVILI